MLQLLAFSCFCHLPVGLVLMKFRPS